MDWLNPGVVPTRTKTIGELTQGDWVQAHASIVTADGNPAFGFFGGMVQVAAVVPLGPGSTDRKILLVDGNLAIAPASAEIIVL